jgi:hypothetical protein
LPSIDVYSAYPSGGWRQRRGWAIENTGFMSRWCAVHLYHDLAKQKKSILWAKDPNGAVSAAVAKYVARGYKFISPPDPQLQFPRDRVSTTSEGALMVTFDGLYERITKYAPNFQGEIDRYLQCRKVGLESLSWFIDDDKKLVMDVNRELRDLRKRQFNTLEQVGKDRETQYNSLRLFKHISSNAPDDVNSSIIPADTPIHYDDPINNKFTQELITSGVVEPMNSCRFWSFLL